MTLKENLIEDMEKMENAMCRIEDSRDIWQNGIIYALCKAVYDVILWIMKKGGGRQ